MPRNITALAIIAAMDPAAFRMKRDNDGPMCNKAAHLPLEIKADESREGWLEGYASVFGAVDSYNESVQPGAFKKSLREWKKSKRPIPMLWQHRGDEPIGGWEEFEEDEKGLRVAGPLMLEIPKAREALVAVKARVVSGISIGYFEPPGKNDPYWDPEREGPRKLYELDLREASVVTFPALREAQLDAIKARIARGEKPTLRDFETLIQRELGLSRSQAAQIAEGGFKGWLAQEGDAEADDGRDPVEKSIDSLVANLSKPLFPTQ
jgi:HK97 family phage prohead protease